MASDASLCKTGDRRSLRTLLREKVIKSRERGGLIRMPDSKGIER